jgi:Peptidase family M41/ATPase family associated with various cellular activities (AAA)
MAITLDRDELARRNGVLNAAATELKAQFIGIDGVIDELVDGIRIWYLLPDLLTRPVIVNLWGMTGVGKTDLVRRLVKAIGFSDRFLEIELNTTDSSSYQPGVSSLMDSNGLADAKPAVVLFDEIQRFNTIDTEGKPMPVTKCSDFWELLSDGRLAKRARDDIDDLISENRYYIRYAETQRKAGNENTGDTDEIGIWEGKNLKRRFGMTESAEEISRLNRKQLVERLARIKDAKTVYEPIDHSKTLILISGNLDEAFTMASMTSEADIEADIFHSFTEKITVVDIKNALSRRFRPEQVARFGNVHLIYRSLKRGHFETLINRELRRIEKRTKDATGITCSLDASINAVVYANGVFPVQGVRPVFSSVADIVETHLTKVVFEAVISGQKRVSLAHDPAAKKIIGTVGKGADAVVMEFAFEGRIEKVRERNVDDVVANVAVHESGHAIAYGVLFGLAPLQLKAKVASSYAAGFTFPHQIHETSGALIDRIKVLLAGGIAEEIVFGRENATIGRSSDRQEATILATDFVRRYAFDREFQATYHLDGPNDMNRRETDGDIEKLVTRLCAETQELLKEHRLALMALSSSLRNAGSLDSAQVGAVLAGHGVIVRVEPEGHLHVPKYGEKLS